MFFICALFFCQHQIICLIFFTVDSLSFIHRAVFKLLSHDFTFDFWFISVYIIWLHFWKIKLLWTQNWTWSCYSVPSNKCFGRDLKVFHGPQSYQSTGSSETSFAMDCNSSCISIGKMFIANFHKAFNNFIWRGWSINEEQIVMLDPFISEVALIVFLFI